MIIANDLRKKNIAEYILYMWQIEDLIRAYDFNIELIKKNLIFKYKKTENVLLEIEHWYEGLIDLMELEKIQHRGHFGFINSIIKNLNSLHLQLINDSTDIKYLEFYRAAEENINQLRNKSKDKNLTDIEIGFNGLYGLLIMRLRKQELSKETIEALKTISNLLSYLSLKFKNKEEEKKNRI